MTVVARGSGDPNSYLREVRDAARAVDDTVALYNVKTMDDHLTLALGPAKVGAAVLSVVGIVALVLTSVGLYGTMAYLVSRRTYEIGVRRALGAPDGAIVGLVVAQASLLIAIALVGGLFLGYASSRLLRSVLYGLDVVDPLAFSLAPTVLMIVAVLASLVPTRRALRIDAARALRHE
jgi:putative ABC transport system permease protein